MQTLVGKKAPDFSATAVIDGCNITQGFSLKHFLSRKYVVLLFYPKDFTFVCPTEIWAFQEKIQEFEKKNVVLVGCSTDSEFSHLA
jgi:peroxiredoxin (alkyl hydroperoxide reductase subunit C)